MDVLCFINSFNLREIDMNKSFIVSAIAVLLLLLSSTGVSETRGAPGDGLWTHEQLGAAAYIQQPGPAIRFTAARVDESNLTEILRSAPMENAFGSGTEMSVPMPDGTFERIRIQESPILSPDLQLRYPEIRTFIAQGVDDRSMTGRLDRTPAGFHGMLISQRGTVYISPGESGDSSLYLSYWKEDALGAPFECSVHSGLGPELLFPANNPSGDQLRTYRLAVSATGEYTQFFGGEANAAAQIVTTINRVTGIYERDLTIRLNLVASNIYDDPDTDPFTGNDVGLMLGENQADLDANVGDANYDVGHIFSQGGSGGKANSGVCVSGAKARGATSLPNPSGDVFDVDFVSHEIGHQYSGSHTWNGTSGSCSAGQFVATSAFEPGSGSTIMAYAGICGGQNVQANSDDYFHVRSFDQITAYRDTGNGQCGADSATGNTPPTVEAGANCTIPTSTPFRLTATGDDANGDALTYSWEQYDAGTRDGLPQSTFTTGPLFRSRDPVTITTRVFPRFEDILSGAATTWEVLPSVNRTLNFRVTARDNRAGAGGVDWDAMVVTVAGDPFGFTSPVAGDALECGQSEAVTWTVGGGSVAPNVKILFSSDGGSSFSSLVASTANDGSYSVTTPKELMATGRFMLEPSAECFFAVSDEFSIIDTLAPSLTVPDDILNECTSPDGTPADLGTPVTSDVCDDTLNVTSDAPALYPLGDTSVEWTATDDSGNATSDIQNVTIVDTTPPSLTAPDDVLAECTSPDGTPVDLGLPTVSDICDASVDVSNDAPALFPIGSTGVLWAATDDSGNQSTDGQSVTVQDTTPPEIFCNSPETITPPDAPLSFTSSAEDICDTDPSVAITEYNCYKLNKKGKLINKKSSCIVSFDGTTISIQDTGGVDNMISWTVEATDNHGNQSIETCEVMVINPTD
jgi:hypothetical protein